MLERIVHVLVVIVPMAVIIFHAAKKSHRLAEFLDAISDEPHAHAHKLQAFLRIWRRKR